MVIKGHFLVHVGGCYLTVDLCLFKYNLSRIIYYFSNGRPIYLRKKYTKFNINLIFFSNLIFGIIHEG